MQNRPTKETILHTSDALDTIVIKLRFMSDAMRYWNINEYELTEHQLYGYGLVTEDIIDEVEEINKTLYESIEK